MNSQNDLISKLKSIDGKSYGSYKSIKGQYAFSQFSLQIDHIQGDPFAAPSKLRLFLEHSEAKIGHEFFSNPSRKTALADFLTRSFYRVSQRHSRIIGSGKSGLISIDQPTQQILPRSSVLIHEDCFEIRYIAGLPANGRRILGHKAIQMLTEFLPDIVENALLAKNLSEKKIREHVETNEDADHLRKQISEKGLVAFVANGSILPRQSGIDDRPLCDEPVRFCSPPSLEVTLTCPNRGSVTGLGIKQGITLIVGGGYHGKSTLLRAIELGVYNHIPGDGREYVVTDPTAVKVRAEDGRSICGVSISPFINNLPQKKSTDNFSSSNASGSTSQAANIVEAIESSTRLLLIDEDTSATNFMIRDRRMQELIVKDKEPITPFSDKVDQLRDEAGISTILVMGGSGDYFEAADTVIAMENYLPSEVTDQAHRIGKKYPNYRLREGGAKFGALRKRVPRKTSFDARRGHREVSIKVRKTDEIFYGQQDIDLSNVEQLVDESQLRAIALAILYAKNHLCDDQSTITDLAAAILKTVREKGIWALSDFPDGDLAFFREQELTATINRMRNLELID